jgi:hypothetical protein
MFVMKVPLQICVLVIPIYTTFQYQYHDYMEHVNSFDPSMHTFMLILFCGTHNM